MCCDTHEDALRLLGNTKMMSNRWIEVRHRCACALPKWVRSNMHDVDTQCGSVPKRNGYSLRVLSLAVLLRTRVANRFRPMELDGG